MAELLLARRNTRRLIARGGREEGGSHYPLLIAFHGSWLVTLAVLGWDAPLIWGWLAAFVLLQALRLWVLVSLGERWTTRIIVIDEPLVRHGPYRFMRHPNYAVVVGEIAVVPLALGLPVAAAIFSVLHLAVLAVRIRAENRALHEKAGSDRIPPSVG